VDIVNADGSVRASPYWFCSNECTKKAINSFVVNKRYCLGRTPYDDPGIPDDHMEEWMEQWWKDQREYLNYAEVQLVTRVADEYGAYVDKLKADITRQEAREIDRLARELIRKQDREREQMEAQAEEDEALYEKLRPKPIPPLLRFSNTHILGPTGAGKTVLLQEIFIDDLWDYKRKTCKTDAPAYVIIDPKGRMIDRLSRLAIFNNEFRDRIVIVDAMDHPALNLFDTKGQNPARIISNFTYIFGTTNTKLTGKQLPCFSFCVSLLFKMPGANINTLRALLDDGVSERPGHSKPRDPRFQQAIRSLNDPADEGIRNFFENDFYSQSYASTRQEVKTRLWSVLHNSDLFAIFNANSRKLDLAQCIKDSKIVMVNTGMEELEEARAVLGRFIIALFFQAVIGRTEKHPAFLMVDEYQEFADADRTPRILRLIREYNAGAIIAHQNMFCPELDDDIRSAISTNTAIKYASDPRNRDIAFMASDMRCDPEFLTSTCVKDETNAFFGCHFTGLAHPFLHTVRFDHINRWPRMTESQYQQFRAKNKEALQAPAKRYDDKKQADKPPEGGTNASKSAVPAVETTSDKAVEPPHLNVNADQPVTGPTKGDPGEPSDTW